MLQRKYIILLLVLMEIGAISIFSQDKVASTRPADIDVYALLDSAKTRLRTDPRISFEYVEKVLTYAIKEKDLNAEALSYSMLGMINQVLEQHDLANGYYVKSINILEKLGNDTELFNTYELYAQSLYETGNNAKSVKYLELCLQYYNRSNNIGKASSIKQQLADIYYSTGQSNEALNLYNEALEGERKVDNKRGEVEIQRKIGDIYLSESKPRAAASNYAQSVTTAKSLNDNKLVAITLEKQSKAYRSKQMYEEELEVRKELSTMDFEEEDLPAKAANDLEMGNIYINLNQEDEAEKHLLESIIITERIGDFEKKGAALKKLSFVYGMRKDYNKALETYKEYAATVDKAYDKQKEEIQASIELYANLNRKLQRLEMLEKDFELSQRSMDLMSQEHQLNNKALRVQRTINYALLGILIFLLFGMFLIYRSSINKRKANQLLALKSLRSQMNPHFIYNSLNSINNYIANNNERAANKYLSSFSKLMRSVMDNSKFDFVPLSSELEIIEQYLQLEYSRFPDKFEYLLEVDKSIDADYIEVPPMLIQPYVENAIWHGLRYKDEKGLLKLSLSKTDNYLQIIIEDDGIGRQKSQEIKTEHQKEHKSSGLKNIENRISIIEQVFNFKLEIKIEDKDKTQKTGTSVTIRIPITKSIEKVA